MLKKHRMAVQAGVSGVSMFIASQMTNVMLSTGFSWSTFERGLTDFFKDGMAGTGIPALGLALFAIGLFGAGLFFVIHKVNQQSSLPRPGGFLMVALVGLVLNRQADIFTVIGSVRDVIFGWFGL